MNVLALSYLFPNRAQPGYGIFVLNRLRAVRRFCDVKVIAPIQWYPFMRLLRGAFWGKNIPQRDEIEGLEVHHPRFAVVPRYFKWFDALSFFWTVRRVAADLRARNFEFDLIDAHWTYPDIVAACWLARKYGKKFVVTVRGHEALYMEEHTIRRWLVAHFLRKADAVVALSAELRDKVIGLGVAPEKVRVVLNGVDVARFRWLDRDECRARLNLPLDRRIVVSVGRLTAGKGHQDLIRAIASVSRKEPTELYIIGGVNAEDDFQRELQALVAELKLNNVHFVDKVPQDVLPLWYAAADVFSLATKREGCPNAVLEALACGTPVAMTDVGAVRELVTPGENGYLVETAKEPELGDAILQALQREWDRKAIARRMEQWGWARCGEQVNDLFLSLTQNAR